MHEPLPPLRELDETDSTNDEARAWALEGAPHGAAVLARAQRRGRGRAGRTWASPRGGLYLSVVLRPQLPPALWGLLPLATGALVAGLLRGRGHPAEVKWPNDVLVEGRKIGGILVETRWGAAPFAVVGIGLNLAAAPREIEGAGGLDGEGTEATRVGLARALQQGVAALPERLGAAPREVLADVRARCATLGREVEWEEGRGRAVDIAEDGALVVEVSGGERRVLAGDVRVRPA